jgi:YHS domain-containing protein
VTADAMHWPHEVGGTTYWFCCLPCHDRFADDPSHFLQEV